MRPIVIAGLLAVLSTGMAAQKPLRVVEGGVLDRVELFAKDLGTPAPTVAAILTFDATEADLGTGGKEGKQTRQDEAQTMQSEGPRVLAERFATALKEAGAFTEVVVLKSGDTPPAGAVVVAGKFLTLDPGSRAKRYFAGFGAGKSSVKVAGTVKDAAGNTLATFEQRRIGSMGMGGGDSLGKLMSDSRSIGEDVAKFLTRWARGQKLED
jgi:hypothetical protein